MEEKNNTGMIAGILVALALIAGGVITYALLQDDDEPEVVQQTTQQTQSTNTQTAQSQPVQAPNIVELAQATSDLSTLVTAVVAADLVDTLSGPGPFTVFAPTNDAFAALPEGTLDSLLEPENVDQLTDILTFHVVPAAAFSTDLSDGMTVTTVQGDELTIGVSEAGVTVNGANVVLADVEASNGVVHVIDAVLLP